MVYGIIRNIMKKNRARSYAHRNTIGLQKHEDKTVYATSDEKYNHREDKFKKIMQDDKYVNEF